MKLKKGSLEAKRFMAKIRAKKGKPKKVSGIKKTLRKKTPTKNHTDINSHNYKISISGINTHKLNKDALSGLRSLAKASAIIWKRNAWGDNHIKGKEKIGRARVLLLEVIMENGYTSTPQGKIIKTIH
jgi:hypothetical protein